MSVSALSRLLEVGVKVVRQARGEAGEVVSDRVEVDKSLNHLTTEELEQIERIHELAAERTKAGED